VSLPNTKQGTATMVSPSSNRTPSPVPSSAVAVLSSDSDLLAAARRASGAEHELLTVATETDLAAQLVNGRAGAVLIDGTALQEPIDTFTERLKKQFPDLVLVVAGGPEDQSSKLRMASFTASCIVRSRSNAFGCFSKRRCVVTTSSTRSKRKR
jgi:hypothetical protein